jgi:hypothetical protein
MFRVGDIVIDRTGWPAWVTTAEAAIDAALLPAWLLPTEKFREITRDLSAIPENQRKHLRTLLDGYAAIGGWNIELLTTTNDVWTARFSPLK